MCHKNAQLQKVLWLVLLLFPEGHSEGYQLDLWCCIFEHLHKIAVYPSNIYADAIVQPVCTTIYKSVLPSELPQLMRVKHHSRYSHQSADVDSLPSGSRNLCDAQHVYDKWSSHAVVHKHSSPSCLYFNVSFCKKQDACSPTWQHHYLIHHIILSQLF